MEPPQNFPIISVQSGVRVEETRFQWRIQNFHVVLLHDSLLNTSGVEFHAGESIGVGSKWSIELSSDVVNGKKWAGLYFTMRERPALDSEFLFVQCAFFVRNREGTTSFDWGTGIRNMYDLQPNSCGLGTSQFVERDGEVAKEESIVIHVRFKIYSPTVITPPSVEGSLNRFMNKSMATLLADLKRLRNSGPLTELQIMSSSNTTLNVEKELLCARSPYFDTLLKASSTGRIIRIPDMSRKTLQVILTYVGTGKLRKEWRERDVIVELTKAAAKFQLAELLNFLDGVVGRVCNLDNVGPLILLAKRLSLKQAGEDLLNFVRNQGAESPENFLQILKSVSSATAGEGSAHCVESGGGGNGRDGPPSATTTPSGNQSGKRVSTSGGGEIDWDSGSNNPPSKMVKRA